METPASTPEPSGVSGDPLAAALFPVILHRVHNGTQFLAGLRTLMELDEAGAALERSATHLAHTADEMRDLGWVFGVLAAALGADLLLERRERDGLRPVVSLVQEALRARGRDLELPPLPELSTSSGSGWEVPWAVASLLFAAGSDLPKGACLTFEVHAHGELAELRADGAAGVGLRAAANTVVTRLPSCRFEADEDGWRFTLPRDWLRPPVA